GAQPGGPVERLAFQPDGAAENGGQQQTSEQFPVGEFHCQQSPHRSSYVRPGGRRMQSADRTWCSADVQERLKFPLELEFNATKRVVDGLGVGAQPRGHLLVGKAVDVQPEHFVLELDNALCRIKLKLQDRKSTRLNSSHVKISYAV